MEVRRIDASDTELFKPLYRSVGWSVYLKDDKAFRKMFANSLSVFGAFLDGELVGIARSVGDDAHILYIQDIIVLPGYQRKGIGSRLLSAVVNHHNHVRQKVLLTDRTDQRARAFYKAQGFKETEEKDLACFVRFD